MKKFTVGFSIVLSVLNIIVMIGLFFYSNHINDRLYDVKEEVDDLSLFFSVNELNDRRWNYKFSQEMSDVHLSLLKKKEQISVLEESIDPKNKRWAKIKKVRKAVQNVIEERDYKDTPNVIGLTRYASAVVDYSERYDVSVPLILGVTTRESAFNQYAVSKARTPARGFMQVIAPTAAECAADLGIRHYNIFTTNTNVRFGTWYLRKMLDYFDNDVELAIKAYNCGPTCVTRVLDGNWRDYPEETRTYVRIVFEWKKRYEDLGL